jgi:hypothetical protein
LFKHHGEIPTGAIDGLNCTYALKCAPIPYSLALVKNGLTLTPNVDYTISLNVIVYKIPLQPSTTSGSQGDNHYAQYVSQ